MKTLKAVVAPWAQNQETPDNSGTNNHGKKISLEAVMPCEIELRPDFDGKHAPDTWREHLARQSGELLHTSPEYERAIEACVSAHRAHLRKELSGGGVSRFEWNPKLVAVAITVLLLLGTIVWAGCRVAEVLPKIANSHMGPISEALVEN